MITKPRRKLLSTKLENLFKEINSTFGHAKDLVMEAYNLAIKEKYTPQEAKKLLLDNITVFKKTQIYAYLPPECKNPVKQKAGSVSHISEVSVPKSEQDTETEQSNPVNNSISSDNEADSYLVESLDISNITTSEPSMEKDRLIKELQKENDELKHSYEKKIQQLKSRISNHSFESESDEQYSNKPTKKQVTELRKKKLPKVYYKSLALIGDLTLPLQVLIYPENDECFLQVDEEVARNVFVNVCKELA